MQLIEKSLHIALRAYAGKTDKAGREYIHHPLRLMAKMKTDLEMSAALLHDVIEDSDITAEQLLAEGIPAEVVEAVVCLSRNENEDYQDFVGRTKKNELAAKIKIADIEDNIDVLRLASLDEYDLTRIKKYHSAWQFLNDKS
ncbi:MAG: GTP pyrophosphokinase [Chloroflexota bacterium]|nr:GTP pyrophosphokinase [Chloroflexota bacterium]